MEADNQWLNVFGLIRYYKRYCHGQADADLLISHWQVILSIICARAGLETSAAVVRLFAQVREMQGKPSRIDLTVLQCEGSLNVEAILDCGLAVALRKIEEEEATFGEQESFMLEEAHKEVMRNLEVLRLILRRGSVTGRGTLRGGEGGALVVRGCDLEVDANVDNFHIPVEGTHEFGGDDDAAEVKTRLEVTSAPDGEEGDSRFQIDIFVTPPVDEGQGGEDGGEGGAVDRDGEGKVATAVATPHVGAAEASQEALRMLQESLQEGGGAGSSEGTTAASMGKQVHAMKLSLHRAQIAMVMDKEALLAQLQASENKANEILIPLRATFCPNIDRAKRLRVRSSIDDDDDSATAAAAVAAAAEPLSSTSTSSSTSSPFGSVARSYALTVHYNLPQTFLRFTVNTFELTTASPVDLLRLGAEKLEEFLEEQQQQRAGLVVSDEAAAGGGASVLATAAARGGGGAGTGPGRGQGGPGGDGGDRVGMLVSAFAAGGASSGGKATKEAPLRGQGGGHGGVGSVGGVEGGETKGDDVSEEGVMVPRGEVWCPLRQRYIADVATPTASGTSGGVKGDANEEKDPLGPVDMIIKYAANSSLDVAFMSSVTLEVMGDQGINLHLVDSPEAPTLTFSLQADLLEVVEDIVSTVKYFKKT